MGLAGQLQDGAAPREGGRQDVPLQGRLHGRGRRDHPVHGVGPRPRPAPPRTTAALRCAQSPWRLPDRRDAHSHITLVHCHMHQPCPPHSSSTPSLTRGARQVQAPLPLHALVTPAGDAQPPLLRPAPRGRDVAH
eukprot:scaffold21866_cov69-Phaeocystis_antarctica.AAC.6